MAITRRHALRLGAAFAAAMAALGPVNAVLAVRPGRSTRSLIDGLVEVERVVGNNVVAKTSTGQISARLVGFPAGFSPRKGDLVAVRTQVTKPLCAPTRPAAVLDGGATAYPVYSWSVGVPEMAGGALRLGDVRLAPSASVLLAAENRTRIAVFVLDSTLPDRQVAFTRPV
jgi:hypothetical protein